MHSPSLAFAVLLAAASSASPHAPAGPERLNALSFENGTILLVDPGSYGRGVNGWAAWNLTDGDEAKGWCSPKGRPTGLAFVWDLDTTWRLDAVAVSTRNLQERGYPGISARTLELQVDAGDGFETVGTFQVGKEERKEFPLPKGTVARKVKAVVVANHGNAEYTEIAELELFGARKAPVAPLQLLGDFTTQYGPIRFTLDGDQVYGCYDYREGATVQGTVVGRNARVTWTEPGQVARQGTATFAVSPDGQRLWGVWYEGGALKGEWAGPRVEPAKGPRCTPRRKGQLEALRKQGRLVLYGIRFDSNSDVPRPESAATLDEVASTLKQDGNLRLLVEGHTDATNTDAYNLDLSQRRAQSVVTALQERGIDATRLQAKGFGRARPVADNATAQGRALNRRVEVSVL